MRAPDRPPNHVPATGSRGEVERVPGGDGVAQPPHRRRAVGPAEAPRVVGDPFHDPGGLLLAGSGFEGHEVIGDDERRPHVAQDPAARRGPRCDGPDREAPALEVQDQGGDRALNPQRRVERAHLAG